MALVFDVMYPGGEVTYATGYPVADSIAAVDIVPRGPEACFGDRVRIDVSRGHPYRVTEIVEGPRRPTHRLRLALDAVAVELWLEEREEQGWTGRVSDNDPTEVWIVAERDDVDVADLVALGAELLS